MERVKVIQAWPYSEIEKFKPWAQKCIEKYIKSGTFRQVYAISHSILIFDFLWESVSPRESWLHDIGKSVLYTLEKIDGRQSPEELSRLDDEILSTLLYIREYFIINECHDPYDGAMVDITKVWNKPEHSPAYYLHQIHNDSIYLS